MVLKLARTPQLILIAQEQALKACANHGPTLARVPNNSYCPNRGYSDAAERSHNLHRVTTHGQVADCGHLRFTNCNDYSQSQVRISNSWHQNPLSQPDRHLILRFKVLP
jgi:hypothetical protein